MRRGILRDIGKVSRCTACGRRTGWTRRDRGRSCWRLAFGASLMAGATAKRCADRRGIGKRGIKASRLRHFRSGLIAGGGEGGGRWLRPIGAERGCFRGSGFGWCRLRRGGGRRSGAQVGNGGGIEGLRSSGWGRSHFRCGVVRRKRIFRCRSARGRRLKRVRTRRLRAAGTMGRIGGRRRHSLGRIARGLRCGRRGCERVLLRDRRRCPVGSGTGRRRGTKHRRMGRLGRLGRRRLLGFDDAGIDSFRLQRRGGRRFGGFSVCTTVRNTELSRRWRRRAQIHGRPGGSLR